MNKKPKLSDTEIMTGITDALGAIAVAASRQLDTERFIADLNLIAQELDGRHGRGPSAGLIDEISRHIAHTLKRGDHH